MNFERYLGASVFLFLVSGCSGADSTSGPSASTGLDLTIAGSTAPFAHDDGASGQTARQVSAGIRSLTLFSDDGSEWTLVDRTPNTVTVSYEDGASTPLAHLAPQEIKSGHYVKARMVQDWSRFDIDVALHDGGQTTPGTLHAFQVTSDGTTIDGTTKNAGYYEQDFEAGATTHHYSGDDALVPADSTTAGAEAVVENGLWAVYFPVDLTIDESAASLRIVVNMDHAFRWSDVAGGDNQPGIYDIAPPLYEPVRQFGGNRFDASLSVH